jgi:type IV pilus assembly protein PilO
MAVMADFARMPTGRKAMVFVVIGAALFGLYFQFSFKALNEHLDQAQADHDSKVATNKRMAEQDLPSFEKLKTRMGQLKKIIDENQKALPTEAELPAFFETLNRKVLESGVEVTRWHEQPEEPIETFVKVPVEVELTGTFMQIKKFFASLVPKKTKAAPAEATDDQKVEERERIVSIENLALSNPTVKNREIVLTAKFIAATYRQEDKAPEPAGKPGAKPAAGAPASKAPLPPASTPAGAKARTENAIDKGDKKDRNATGVDEAKTPAGSGAQKLKGGM